MTCLTDIGNMMSAVFNEHEQKNMKIVWQKWQNQSNRHPLDKTVYVFDEEGWLEYQRDPMVIVRELEFLRILSSKHAPSLAEEKKWVHRLVDTNYWKDLMERDQIDLQHVPEIQRIVDNFQANMKDYSKINPRASLVCVLYTKLDTVSLEEKMKKYLSKPYECANYFTSGSRILKVSLAKAQTPQGESCKGSDRLKITS